MKVNSATLLIAFAVALMTAGSCPGRKINPNKRTRNTRPQGSEIHSENQQDIQGSIWDNQGYIQDSIGDVEQSNSDYPDEHDYEVRSGHRASSEKECFEEAIKLIDKLEKGLKDTLKSVKSAQSISGDVRDFVEEAKISCEKYRQSICNLIEFREFVILNVDMFRFRDTLKQKEMLTKECVALLRKERSWKEINLVEQMLCTNMNNLAASIPLFLQQVAASKQSLSLMLAAALS